MASSYISTFSSSKWEDWREGWVIVEADPHDRLELPTRGPQSDRSTWKAKSTIPKELGPVLDRQRSRMAYMYTGLNDCCRIARGPGTDFTRAELEVAIRGMTGDAFSPESLLLPSGVKALCEDQALRASLTSDTTSTSVGAASAGGSGPQPVPAAARPSGPEPEATTPLRPEPIPEEEATGPAAPTEAPEAAAAPDAELEPPPAEPAAAAPEEAAPEAAAAPLEAVPEAAAAPEVAEVAYTTTPPAQEEEPEVVLGRRLLPSPAEVPLPRLFAKSLQAQALERELLAETRVQAAAEREQTALELANEAKKVVAMTVVQEATLAELAAAAAKREERLAAREVEEVSRLEELQEREAAVEKELAARTRRLREHEAALQERVAKAPSSLSVALQVLDSTAERLQGLESGMLDLLETEGIAVAWGTAEYILTSFRSHNPAIQLTPVLVGPIRATAAAAKEGVQEAADMVVSRIRRRPDTSGPPGQ
ncbi:fibrous sheath CABYR-binding protein-like [Panicum hallii]|uniref:fibrous sheath CABYR-binding protein-like n=1 Tax=Panicum hallii TaxID=206008 RepID=UPI000DF4DBD2|nr:fibrous sheath CABYR-binding protein-like [Panicum hallii]